MRQVVNSVETAKSDAIKSSLLASENEGTISLTKGQMRPLAPLTEELNEAAKEMQQKQKEAFLCQDLSQYQVKGSKEVWSSALSKNKGNLNMISVKTGEKRQNPSEANESLEKDSKKPKKFKKKKLKN